MLNRSLNASLTASLRLREGPKHNNFNFLMQSMERDKQNLNSNLTSSSTTTDFVTSKRDLKKSINEFNDPPATRGFGANSKATVGFDMDLLVRRTEAYMVVSEKIIDMANQNNGSLRSQLTKLGEDIQLQFELFRKQNTAAPFFNNVSLRKSFNVKESVSRREQANFMRKLKDLESDNEKLNELVAKHENTNIKMFIKINEEESCSIQHYKALLESSYEGYKQLEAKLKEYEIRIGELLKDKQIVEKESANKTKVIEYLQEKLRREGRDKTQRDNQGNAKLQALVIKQNKELEALYANMKQILAKHEEMEKQWAEENMRLKKKLKDKRYEQNKKQIQPPLLKKSSREQQSSKQEGLGNEIFSYLLIQANTIEEFLSK